MIMGRSASVSVKDAAMRSERILRDRPIAEVKPKQGSKSTRWQKPKPQPELSE